MASSHFTKTLTDIKAKFPPQNNFVEGRPTLRSLISILKRLTECGKSHSVHGLVLGLLQLVLEPGLNGIYTWALYPNRTPDTGQVLFYVNISNSTVM